MTAPTREQLNVPLQESTAPIDPANALSEYGLTTKLWRSQTFGKLRDWILGGRSSRGRLLATSSLLPTTAGNRNDDIPGVTWTVESDSQLTTSGITLTMNQLPAANQIGWWFYAEVAGAEQSAGFMVFGGIGGTRDLRLSTPSPSIYVFEDHNAVKLQYGGGGSLPARVVVKVYLAVI